MWRPKNQKNEEKTASLMDTLLYPDLEDKFGREQTCISLVLYNNVIKGGMEGMVKLLAGDSVLITLFLRVFNLECDRGEHLIGGPLRFNCVAYIIFKTLLYSGLRTTFLIL